MNSSLDSIIYTYINFAYVACVYKVMFICSAEITIKPLI